MTSFFDEWGHSRLRNPNESAASALHRAAGAEKNDVDFQKARVFTKTFGPKMVKITLRGPKTPKICGKPCNGHGGAEEKKQKWPEARSLRTKKHLQKPRVFLPSFSVKKMLGH